MIETTRQLSELFALHGTPATANANNPLPLIDPGAVWLVDRGHLDIVAMTIVREGGTSDLQRTHLLRVEAEELLFGFHAPPRGHRVLLMGYGSPDTQLMRLPVTKLASAVTDHPELAGVVAPKVDRWVSEVSELCTADLAPTGVQNLRPGTACPLLEGQSGQPQSGVLWVRTTSAPVQFMGQNGGAVVDEGVLFPLSKDAWVTAAGECTVEPSRGGDVLADEAAWRGLDAFQRAVEGVIDVQRSREREQFQRRLQAKSEAARTTMTSAFTDLSSILNRPRGAQLEAADAQSALVAACRLVGRPLGLEVQEPPPVERRAGHDSPLEEIAKSSRFAMRRVRLVDKWHRHDGGPPSSPRSYQMHNPAEGTVQPVTAQLAREIDPIAFTFYRSLPDRPLKGIDLVRFTLRGLRHDLSTVAMIGAAGGMLTLATPLAIGHVFDVAIPAAEELLMIQIMMALVVAAFATASFNLTRNVALIRMQHRAGNALQAAVWERLVNLPARFFTKYSAGDLGVRAMGIDRIMATLSTSVMTGMVTSIFSVFSIGLLFYYNPAVALVAMGLVAV
ncbi:MAG: ABC transporter transmembrane domain-containing protein, partial [Planctomycetota bacterium]